MTSYLEDSEQCDGKGIEVGRWRSSLEVELTSEELHTEQSKYENEEEEQEEERYDATHWIEQWYYEVPQASPIFCNFEDPQ